MTRSNYFVSFISVMYSCRRAKQSPIRSQGGPDSIKDHVNGIAFTKRDIFLVYFVTYTIKRRKNKHKHENSAGRGFRELGSHGREEKEGKYQILDKVQQFIDTGGAGIYVTARN